jgi:hypothetical protein
VKDNDELGIFPGLVYVSGDPRIPKDNSMQTSIPGTNLIIDAMGVDESQGKAQFINENFNVNDASCRIRQAPGGLNYCIAYSLGEHPKGTELETNYGPGFWCRKHQWDQLPEEDQILASVMYNITKEKIVA